MKKTICTLLTALLVLGMLAFTAFAAEATVSSADDLLAAVENADEATTIKLGAPIYLEETVEIPAGKDITLDLNGQQITVYKDESAQRSLYAFNNYGKFTLMDSAAGGSITAVASKTWAAA